MSLSADGNTALVGGTGDGKYYKLGAAWAFKRTGELWSQLGNKIQDATPVGDIRQGSSVSLSGDGTTAVVAGTGVDGATGESGGPVWVYSWTGTNWIQLGGKLKGVGEVGNSGQGASVFISGNGSTIAVGGPGDNGVGAVWIYTRTSTGTLRIDLFDVETSWPRPGTSAKVTLYNASGDSVAEMTADASSQVTFTGLPSGSAYYYRVKVYRDPWGWQYWGERTGISITAGETTNSTLLHNTPVLWGVSIYVDATNDHLAEGARREIAPGTQLRVEIVIANPTNAGAVAATAKGSLIVDRDTTTDYDFVANSTTSVAVVPGALDTVYCYLSPTQEGEYWYAPAVYSSAPAGGGSTGYGLVCTDGGKWNESGPAFVVVQAPSTPFLSFPANKASNLPTIVTLAWHPVSGASHYHLQLSTDSTFASGVVVNDSSIVDTSRLAGQLAQGTRYFWRVRAKTTSGMGPFSLGWSFRTLLASPTQVQLLTPSPGMNLNVNTVAFVWRTSQPEVVRYWFEIAADSQFVFRTVDSTLVDTFFVRQNLANDSYWWRVRAGNATGWGPYSESRNFVVTVTGIDVPGGVPASYVLFQNHPNPFNPLTSIRYGLPARSHVKLEVFNTLGQQLATIVEGDREAGYHEVRFAAQNLSSGIYLYRLTAGSFVQTRKLLLVR